jgi:ComF family protein
LPLAPGSFCPDCADADWDFGSVFAASVFEGLWRDVLHEFKFRGRLSFSRPLAASLSGLLGAEGPWDAVVPVPAGPESYASRGYDQCKELAARLAPRLGLPLAPVLRKEGGRRRQSELRREERRANARGAFQARLPQALQGRRLLLVDDILTTGATAQACAFALKQAGAAAVDVAVLARSPAGV